MEDLKTVSAAQSENAEKYACIVFEDYDRKLVRHFVDHYNQHFYPRVKNQTRLMRWKAGLLGGQPKMPANEQELDLRLIKLLVLIALVILVLTLCNISIANAATIRPAWVEEEIYQYNHPFAAQLPNELETKMKKMAGVDFKCNQSPESKRQPSSPRPFSFYRGTAHIFYKDMLTLPASKYVLFLTRLQQSGSRVICIYKT